MTSRRAGASISATARAQPVRRTRLDAGVKKSLRVERSAALRMGPRRLRSVLALEEAHTVVLDYELEDDLTALEADEVDFDDMEGDEIIEDRWDESGAPPEPMGDLLGSGSLDVRLEEGPFLDASSIYAVTVAPCGDERLGRCRFEPPGWFAQVRQARGRSYVRGISTIVGAVAELFSEEADTFLDAPSPAVLAACEWRYFSSGQAPLRETILLQKGLAARLNERLEATERTDETELGGLLPDIWFLWPQVDRSSRGPGGPVLMPLAVIYDREFQIEAAACLCLSGFSDWTLDDADRPAEWNRRREASRPFKLLDQRQRLHLLANLLRVGPSDLLGEVEKLAQRRRIRAVPPSEDEG